MQIRIHRGTKEIGGTCIELMAGGKRLLLDLGLPLGGDPDDATLHPAVDGLTSAEDHGGDDSNCHRGDDAGVGETLGIGRTDGSLLGLVLSHGHLDHWGLAHLARPDLPVMLGAATLRILQAAAPFVPHAWVPATPVTFASGRPFGIGPFTVTPHLVDHSAFDAHALEVEADGCRLFYSGDLRAHGRKAALFERLVSHPPRDVDVMLMEGSSFGRLDPEARFPTEAEIEAKLAAIMRDTAGMVLVAASAQNIDRMVSIHRAARRTGRTLVVDLYAAEILSATGNPNIPQSDWPDLALFLPQHQRVRIKRTQRFDILEAHRRARRLFPEDLKALAGRIVVLFRPAMLGDLDRADCLAGASAVWSQWEGYLTEPRGLALQSELESHAIPLRHAHTSGHAVIADLKRLAEAVAPRMLVPVHTVQPERFADVFGNVVTRDDGVWWPAAAA